VTADVPPSNGQRVGNGAFDGCGVAAGEMEVLLEVGRFDMDGGMELTMTHTDIHVQKCDFRGGGVPGELDGIAAVDAFKELGEGVGTMRPKEENVIDKTQPEAGFLDSRVKEILFKETH
jgi:hypothetical protein